MAKVSKKAPILTVSVAAELAGMHPQTVRQYDRLGLVVASRTRGGGRRYSLEDVERLIEIQRLSQEDGVNLAGITKIFELESQIEKLQRDKARLERELDRTRAMGAALADELTDIRSRDERIFAVSPTGEVTVAERLEQLRAALHRGRRHESESRARAIREENSGTAVVPIIRSREVTVWDPFPARFLERLIRYEQQFRAARDG
ncbi:MAG: MerR family transcriptional regulator [Actinomycetaceae bacterium]|nr:MerR family transcriptional regulator [Actinomycetaceae bacterium]